MNAKHALILLSLAVLAGSSFAAEEVKITTFELRDGKKYEALNWSSFGSTEYKTYTLTTVDGRKTMLLAKDVVRNSDRIAAVNSLPAEVKPVVQNYLAAIDAARANAEAAAREERIVNEARRGQRDAEQALKKAVADLSTAKNLLTSSEQAIQNSIIELATASARYDAAKTELGAGTGVSFVRTVAYDSFARSDNLRNTMVKAAEDKARVELERKDAEAILARTKDTIKPLTERVAELEKSRDAARVQADRIIQEARDEEKERTAKADAELQIGKKQ